MPSGFCRTLRARLDAGTAPAVLGLDPRPEALPERLRPDAPTVERIDAFYAELLPRLAEHAVAVKPNIAFFERFGAAGYGCYERVCAAARAAGLLVIGDVKRGDIGSTAEAYAEAHFRHADAVTLHPYLGTDSLEPFLRACREPASRGGGKAVFVLVRTSNASAAELQDQRLDDGRTVAELVADAVDRLGRDTGEPDGYAAVGAVVGATWPERLAALRARMPRAWILLPGVGAQGATAADTAPAFDAAGRGALVSQSRGVLQAFPAGATDWADRVVDAATRFAAELHAIVAARRAGAAP